MPELAEVFRTFGPAYLERFGGRMPPSHRRALSDLVACRTEVMGGHLAQCDCCGHQHYSYHSCRNRSCPKCRSNDTAAWLEKRRSELLPTSYFHLVFTLPETLRDLVRRNQKDLLGSLMSAAAQSLQSLASDPRYVGGEMAVLAVLHTWTRSLIYHPHVHCLVPGGGLAKDGTWHPARKKYLLPVTALSTIFRARFMALARKALPDEVFPESLWDTPWVVYCKPALQGSEKLLDYLGRYIHRVAITNRRIKAIRNGLITFEFKDAKAGRWKTMTLPAEEFLRRFLQHVLPKGFHKVRYYGLLSPRKRTWLKQLQLLLAKPVTSISVDHATQDSDNGSSDQLTICPECADGHMVVISWLPRHGRSPP
jgi:hypothetical protein